MDLSFFREPRFAVPLALCLLLRALGAAAYLTRETGPTVRAFFIPVLLRIFPALLWLVFLPEQKIAALAALFGGLTAFFLTAPKKPRGRFFFCAAAALVSLCFGIAAVLRMLDRLGLADPISGMLFWIACLSATLLLFLPLGAEAVLHDAPPSERPLRLLWFLLFPVALLLYLCTLYAHFRSMHGQEFSFAVPQMMLCLLLSIGAYLYLAITLGAAARGAALQEQLSQMELCEQSGLLRFEQLEAENARLAALRRDSAAELSEVRALLDNGSEPALAAAEARLRALAGKSGPPAPVLYSRNYIVNAVLTCKAQECDRLGVRFRWNVQIPEQLPVADIHLCSLLSNLLDNAVRAASRTEAGDVTLDLRADGGRFRLMVTNSWSPQTDNRGSAGLGTGIVRDLSEQYGGEFLTDDSGGRFTALVRFPLKEVAGRV